MSDFIAYTINGNVMKGIVLSKKGQVRYTSSPIIPRMEGKIVGHSSIVAEFGGKLRLIGSTGGGAAI